MASKAQRRVAKNGAPTGYGQQQGQSPFLDQAQDQGGDERSTRMAHERMAPAAPAFEPMQEFAQQFPDMAPEGAQPAWKEALQSRGGGVNGRPPMGGGMPPIAASRGGMQTQPMGQPTPMQSAQQSNGGAAAPGQPPSPQGFAKTAPQVMGQGTGSLPTTAGQVMGTGNPLGGANTGVAGAQPDGMPMQTGQEDPRSAASRFAAQNNYIDIEGAQGLATGPYAIEGFGDLNSTERGSWTHKKTFARIASRYDPMDPQSTQKMMADPDFKAFFPDAKLIEHPNADLIDFGDGNPVDIKRASVNGAAPAWQWGVNAGAAPGGAMPGAGPMQGGVGGPGGDALSAQLMQALQGGGGFGDGSVTIEQILESLGLGQQAQQFGI